MSMGGKSKQVTETVKADEGEFILTTQRLIFNGNSKPLDLPLRKLIAVDVEDGFLEVGHGQRTYRFHFPSESPMKWEAYVRAVAALASG